MTKRRLGKFITLEGIDGAGKSSHVAAIRALLEERAIEVVLTREPGGTPLGEKLRQLLLNEPMHPDTEALLIFAARAEHLQQVIAPALARGAWVVSDRFTDATFAYQGAGRGMDEQRLAVLESWVQQGRNPDLTLLFDVPAAVGMDRRKAVTEPLDRFERERLEFFERVRRGYLDRAAESGGRIVVVDANLPMADVRAIVDKIIATLCEV